MARVRNAGNAPRFKVLNVYVAEGDPEIRGLSLARIRGGADFCGAAGGDCRTSGGTKDRERAFQAGMQSAPGETVATFGRQERDARAANKWAFVGYGGFPGSTVPGSG